MNDDLYSREQHGLGCSSHLTSHSYSSRQHCADMRACTQPLGMCHSRDAGPAHPLIVIVHQVEGARPCGLLHNVLDLCLCLMPGGVASQQQAVGVHVGHACRHVFGGPRVRPHICDRGPRLWVRVQHMPQQVLGFCTDRDDLREAAGMVPARGSDAWHGSTPQGEHLREAARWLPHAGKATQADLPSSLPSTSCRGVDTAKQSRPGRLH